MNVIPMLRLSLGGCFLLAMTVHTQFVSRLIAASSNIHEAEGSYTEATGNKIKLWQIELSRYPSATTATKRAGYVLLHSGKSTVLRLTT